TDATSNECSRPTSATTTSIAPTAHSTSDHQSKHRRRGQNQHRARPPPAPRRTRRAHSRVQGSMTKDESSFWHPQATKTAALSKIADMGTGSTPPFGDG